MATPTEASQPTPRQTREQQRAQRAYQLVEKYREGEKEAEYKRFCKRFPALIQSCGLVQAVAFAEAKLPIYLNDLAKVVKEEMSRDYLAEQARIAPLTSYQKLSRDTLSAATWLKRYAEALLKGDD